MKTVSRVAAAVGLLIVIAVPAYAQTCGSAGISPNPGWRGAPVTISGTGFTPGTQIFVNFGGNQIGTTTSNSEGAFTIGYTIPGDFPVGETNIFVQDAPANCEANPSYIVNADPPAPTTTVGESTTTTAAPVTTVAPTTSVSPTTTPVPVTIGADDGSDSTQATTTTTTLGSTGDSESGGSSGILQVLLGALGGAGLLGVGVMLGRRSNE